MGMTLPARQRFHFSWRRHKVRVRPAGSNGGFTGHAITDKDVEEIDQFVQANQLGKRVSYDMWQLNSAAAVTMFRLKWS